MTVSRYTRWCLVVGFFFSTAAFADFSRIDAQSSNPVITKSQIDKRDYHYQVLDNQLRVLLISDPKADKAAAALDVGIGSADDPVDRPGLAHFLEHMLFLGTKKYPSAGDYQAFISAQGGSHNAYTSSSHTNYFFEVDASQLAPALDRFAQFFIAPLFDTEYVDRERHAVHSEYQAKIKDDFRRGYDVYRELLNPKHPQSKFSVGSLTTLADRPNDTMRDALLTFYDQHYSADNMALVVLGKESIDELKKLVLPMFDPVALRKTVPRPTGIPLFNKGQLPMEALIQPVALVRRMTMMFSLPSVEPYYREKPLQYIGHLLGHEGEGSLLSLLKRQGWAEGLSAGGGSNGPDYSSFQININLTEEGIKHREAVRALVFHTIKLIRETGVEAWRFEEEQKIYDVAFRYRESGNGMRTVSALANSIHYYEPKDVIRAGYAYDRFDSQLIKSLLAKFTPDNLLVMTSYPGAETDKISYYYSTPYSVNKLPATSSLPKEFKPLLAEITLPKPNIFIPESTELLASAEQPLAEPVLLRDTINQKIWFRQDTQFAVPKANIYLRLKSPVAAQSAQSAALNHLFVAMVQDHLNEQSYPAALTGLSFSLEPNSRGVDIEFRGYNDRMPMLMDLVVDKLRKPVLSEQRFESLRTELLRQWRNSRKQTPYRQLLNEAPVLLFDPYWGQEVMADQLEQTSFKALEQYANTWRNGAVIEGLFYGNLTQKSVESWLPDLDALVVKSEKALAPARVLKIQNESLVPTSSIKVDHNDNAVTLYIQGLEDTLEDKAKMLLLRQVMESSFYTDLRTEQQLGYIVFLTGMGLKKVPGSLFVVQSPNTAVPQIQQAIRQFIDGFNERFPKELAVHQQAVVTQLLERPTSLASKSSRYWTSILRDDNSFDYRNRLAEAVQGVSPKALRDYYLAVMKDPAKSYWLTSRNNDKTPAEPVIKASNNYYIYP